MKKLFYTLILIAMLSANTGIAQFKTAPDGVTAKRVLMDFYTPANDFDPITSLRDLKLAKSGSSAPYWCS